MLSPQLQLVWAVLGVTVLVFSVSAAPTASIVPTKPPCDLKIVSKVKQDGVNKGGAALTTTGSTQGVGSVDCIVRSPTSVVKKTAVGNSGATASSVSADNGSFTNLVKALTNVKTTKDGGTKVKTKTVGLGATEGKAAIFQIGDANGGTTLKEAELSLATNGKDLFKVTKIKQATITAASGHKGSGAGDSLLKVLNEAETKVNLKDF